MNNLVISYDLHQPLKNYDAVINAIKRLSGKWAKAHFSVFYVKANMTAAQARDALLPYIDKDDSLFVVDATNDACAWQNISDVAAQYIKANWPGTPVTRGLGALQR